MHRTLISLSPHPPFSQPKKIRVSCWKIPIILVFLLLNFSPWKNHPRTPQNRWIGHAHLNPRFFLDSNAGVTIYPPNTSFRTLLSKIFISFTLLLSTPRTLYNTVAPRRSQTLETTFKNLNDVLNACFLKNLLLYAHQRTFQLCEELSARDRMRCGIRD